MEGAFQLIAFSVVMLVGSYFAGSIPLFMPMSEEKLQLVSVLGAGLLVGTALAVIIPEGMQTLLGAYTQQHAEHAEHGDSHNHLEGIDRAIGISLVLGFLFMLLIDQLASNHVNRDVEQGRRPPVNWTTTLGLVVHAAADGIALGAAASTHQVDVEIIVFLAIMLHKAPAAFGLVTFLLHEGLERTRIRKHLLVFALSAPLLAVVTFFCLAASDKDTLNTHNATGIAMLFSAGTFLYVATVHVLPEVTSVGSGHSHNADKASGFSKMELLMLTIGTLLPLLLTVGHHH